MGLLRSRLHLIRTLLPASLVLIIPAQLSAQAQASTGVIRGVVADSSGRPLDHATVSLRHLATNAERTLTTNASGVYVATLLRVGVYDIRARAVGYRAKQEDSVAVGLGETVETNFALAPQIVQLEELLAEAPEPLVDPTKSESATRLGVEAVDSPTMGGTSSTTRR
jgi:hypothetical protein